MYDVGKEATEVLKAEDKRTVTVDILTQTFAEKKFKFLTGIETVFIRVCRHEGI